VIAKRVGLGRTDKAMLFPHDTTHTWRMDGPLALLTVRHNSDLFLTVANPVEKN